MKKTLICIFSASLLVACGGAEGDQSTDENASGNSIVANTNPETGNNGNSTSTQDGNEEAMATTTIEYFETSHDFGNVFYPSDNKFTFKFKNTGNAPLVIDDAKASCGCTVPSKPEEPIPPGGIGELDVIFRPKNGQVGQEVTKKITVTANTSPSKETYLEIHAKVLDAM